MKPLMPDFLARSESDQARIGAEGAALLLDAGRRWDLAPVLRAGGSIVFPHATIDVCGHQIAAAVHACLDSGAGKAVAVGVLHARNPELTAARERVAAGGDCGSEPSRGIQGPDWPGREDWRQEFSLSHFQFLWTQELKRRGVAGPALTVCYVFLAGGSPEDLPGMERLREVCRDAVVVATMDPFHHGIGYGDTEEVARFPERGGLDSAWVEIEAGFSLLQSADYRRYEQHCIRTKSDGRDVGQVLRLLMGPLEADILDLVADDMAPVYAQPDPTWVAGALIALNAGSRRTTERH